VTGPIVGVDIGGTKILAVRLGHVGTVEHETRLATPQDGDEVIERVRQVVTEVAQGESPSAIGVGIPCLVDRSGAVRFSPHLSGLVGLPVVQRLRDHFPLSTLWVGNDATAAGWAEHRLGAAAGADDVLMVTLGTGIGGGIVGGGRLTEGANRFAGEFGHMVVDPHGPVCPCGKQGCWERYASGSGLGQLGREAALGERARRVRELAGGDSEAVRGEHVTIAAAEGDADALRIMGRFAWWLALGLANLANIFDPEVIVLGGGLIRAGAVLLDPVHEAFEQLVEAADERGVRIQAAALGEHAGAIGAGLVAAGNAMGVEGAVH
jgi:glucokinase